MQKIKNPLSDIIFSQNAKRQAVKARKKFQSKIPLILDPGMKILKKLGNKFKKLKTSFRHYFQPKRDEMGQERERNFTPKFRSYQPELENSKKKKSKKIQKIKKVNSGIISIQNGLREAEKERKKFNPKFCSYPTRTKNSKKKKQKNSKN